MIENKEVLITWQENILLETLLSGIVEDETSSGTTRTVAINLLEKLKEE